MSTPGTTPSAPQPRTTRRAPQVGADRQAPQPRTAPSTPQASATQHAPQVGAAPQAPGTSTASPAIQLRHVTKSFGHVQAVKGVDLTIHQGEVVAFLGPNGAGKTTTIDMILGLSKPTSGEVEVFGQAPHSAISKGLVSAVMQTGGLLKDLTVRETVEYTAALFADARPVAEVLETAGITEIADRRVGKCSGGEQQRVRFAMALVPDPALIILDEPTTGMDVNARRSFWESIHADAEQGRTILFATHYLEEADAWADRVVMMRSGEMVADGSAADIRAAGGGRRITAHWPHADVRHVQTWPGVRTAEMHGEQLVIQASDSDAVARELFLNTPARDVEITSRGLEDAFVELTTTRSTALEGATR